MDPAKLFQRHQELQRYVGWTEDDARAVHSLSELMEPHGLERFTFALHTL